MNPKDTETPPSGGEWLRSEVRQRGLGDSAVTRALGVSTQTVQNWYRGTPPKDKHAAGLARLLNMPEIVVRAKLGLHIPEELKDMERALHAIRDYHRALWPGREAEFQRLLSEFAADEHHK